MEILDDIEILPEEEKASPSLILVGFFVGLVFTFLAFAFFTFLSGKSNLLDSALYHFLPIGGFAFCITLVISHLIFLTISKHKKQNSFFIYLIGVLFSLLSIYMFMTVVTITEGYTMNKFIEGLYAGDVLLVSGLNYLNFIICTFFVRWKWFWVLILVFFMIAVGLLLL